MKYIELLENDPEAFIRFVSLKPRYICEILDDRLYDAYDGTYIHYVIRKLLCEEINDFTAFRVINTIIEAGGSCLVEDCSGMIPYDLFNFADNKEEFTTYYYLLHETTRSIIDEEKVSYYKNYRNSV